ncbi:MAG: response regulator [Clostridia bacterium]|nr:response regulator [Clostridia bacterium]
MRILAVDDERTSLNILGRAIREALPEADLRLCLTISEAFEELANDDNLPDVAFLDIEMPGMTGLELAKLIKVRAPRVNIIFVTGYSQYALDAISMRPSGYVMKPADKQCILAELENLRNPPRRKAPAKRIRAQCFGDFELFVDEKPVVFARSKSKEMLAYLVDRRGASCSATKIASALWDDGVYDRARQKLFSTIYADMLKALRLVSAENIIKRSGNGMAVDANAFDCDYYMALQGDMVSVNSFMGEYMAAYSWAEFTTGALNSRFSTREV